MEVACAGGALSAAQVAEAAEADKERDRAKQQLSRLKQQIVQMQEDQEAQLSWRVDAEVGIVCLAWVTGTACVTWCGSKYWRLAHGSFGK